MNKISHFHHKKYHLAYAYFFTLCLLTSGFHPVNAQPEPDKIIITYPSNFIHFTLSLPGGSTAGIDQYAYILEGHDQDWNNHGFEASVLYSGLQPGNYIFRVKSLGNQTILPADELAVKVIIRPPWWRSWWAFSLYGSLIISVLLIVRRYELNRVRLRTQLKLEMIRTDSLRNLDQLKTQFFTNISHEFRTPLTLILGEIESVLASDIISTNKQKLKIARKNAQRLLTLINQLLDLAKLEADRMRINPSKQDMVKFLKGLVFSFNSLADSKKITLLFESDPESIPMIFDLEKMEKIFYNLLSNAIKFTETNGIVKVAIKDSSANFAEISVENSGHGIPADQLEHIFNRFYQVDNSSTRNHDGTGIGLALVKELVELHNGIISVTSKEGENTIFIVRLPIGGLALQKEIGDNYFTEQDSLSGYYGSEVIPEADGLSILSEKTMDDGREWILIVEDNIEVRTFIREQLESDYQVTEAANGKEGISKAQETMPDLIITDLMMPVMDGYQFCREIRGDERTCHIPVIMLTARAGFEDKMAGLETGVDDYLTKPFSTNELKVRTRNLITQRRLLRARFKEATIIKPSEVTTISVDQAFLRKIIATIEANFENQDFSVEKLAFEVNMSVSQLNRKLNALINQPAGQLMRSLKLHRAADLLQNNAGSVSEICYKLGFTDQSHFSRSFKKQFGCSPSKYPKG